MLLPTYYLQDLSTQMCMCLRTITLRDSTTAILDTEYQSARSDDSSSKSENHCPSTTLTRSRCVRLTTWSMVLSLIVLIVLGRLRKRGWCRCLIIVGGGVFRKVVAFVVVFTRAPGEIRADRRAHSGSDR